jgi:hypothetical protein
MRTPCISCLGRSHLVNLAYFRLGRLVDAKIFTQLGLRDGYLRYHQTIVRSAWKIPFCTRGHLEYRVMPFGIANTPAKAYLWNVFGCLFERPALTHVMSFAWHHHHVMFLLDNLLVDDMLLLCRFIDDTLCHLLDTCCVICLVDIVIYSSSAEEHKLHVRLLWLRKFGLLLC